MFLKLLESFIEQAPQRLSEIVAVRSRMLFSVIGGRATMLRAVAADIAVSFRRISDVRSWPTLAMRKGGRGERSGFLLKSPTVLPRLAVATACGNDAGTKACASWIKKAQM
eukprot:653818-Rhodomonas_salina.2